MNLNSLIFGLDISRPINKDNSTASPLSAVARNIFSFLSNNLSGLTVNAKQVQ